MLHSKNYTTKLDSHPFWCRMVGGCQLHAQTAPESCCRGAYLRKTIFQVSKLKSGNWSRRGTEEERLGQSPAPGGQNSVTAVVKEKIQKSFFEEMVVGTGWDSTKNYSKTIPEHVGSGFEWSGP